MSGFGRQFGLNRQYDANTVLTSTEEKESIMKSTTLITSLIASGLLATSAFAGTYWGGKSNSDAYGYVLNDLNKPAFVGTSFSVASPRIDPYNGFTVGNVDIDQSGFAIGAAGPESSFGPWGHGNQDAYGTVLPR